MFRSWFALACIGAARPSFHIRASAQAYAMADLAGTGKVAE